MLIEAGFTIAFECPAPTPMLLQLNIHPSRDADLLTRDTIASDPPLPMRNYLDLFGNRIRASRCRQGSSPSPTASSLPTREAGRNAAGREDDADRRSSRRGAGVPGLEPLLRQRQTRRLRLVAIWETVRRREGRASDLGFRSRENPLQLRRRPLDPRSQRLPCTRASGSAATSPISPSRSAAA